MDTTSFDLLCRQLGRSSSRRAVLHTLGSALLGGAVGSLGLASVGAKRKKGGKKGKKGKKKPGPPPPPTCAETCGGCCQGETCRDGDEAAACGTDGAPCATCATCQTCASIGACAADVELDDTCCLNGAGHCQSGQCQPCADGQRCVTDGCICDATSCATGCCTDQGTCLLPASQTPQVCGTGVACSVCPSDGVCEVATCTDGQCGVENSPNGESGPNCEDPGKICCDGSCVTGVCCADTDCAPNATCVNNECFCGDDPCGEDEVCFGGLCRNPYGCTTAMDQCTPGVPHTVCPGNANGFCINANGGPYCVGPGTCLNEGETCDDCAAGFDCATLTGPPNCCDTICMQEASPP